MSEGVERVDREELNVFRRELVAGTSVVAGAAVLGAVPRKVAAQQDPDNEISGTVTDAIGAVNGATVVAVPHDQSLDPLVTTTDANGDYVFGEGDLYTGDELYHVIARDGTESDPRRGQENYPFLLANGGDLPASAVRQWPFPERTTSTVVERLANDDGTVSGGPTNTADASFYEGYYEATDGTDDAVLLPVAEFQSQIQSKDFGFAFTVRTTDESDQASMFGSLDAAADNRFQMYQLSSSNNWNFRVDESGSNNALDVPNSEVSDGTIHRIFIAVSTDDATNWTVYSDDTDTNASVQANNVNDLSQINLAGNRVAVGAQEFGGSITAYAQLDADNPILYDSPSRQDVTDDYNLQPWS